MTFWTGPGYNYREDAKCCARCKYVLLFVEGEAACSYGLQKYIKGLDHWDSYIELSHKDRNVERYGLCDKYRARGLED